MRLAPDWMVGLPAFPKSPEGRLSALFHVRLRSAVERQLLDDERGQAASALTIEREAHNGRELVVNLVPALFLFALPGP